MIGAFYQPQAVIIDVDTLSTLNDREYSAGMAEVIKYGLLGNIDFLSHLEANIDPIMKRDNSLIIDLIYRSCKDKSIIVSQDEFEHGKRALLNFGHTFGHAIENTFGYGVYLHGEAVSIGMCMASMLSQFEGELSQTDFERIQSILSKANLPISISKGVKSESLIQAMSVDKKAVDGSLRLVLLNSVGSSFVTGSYSKENFQKVISNFC
jgi:3-dehydroquinate synthase